MADAAQSQVVFERYLRGEITLEAAADALVDLALQTRAEGGDLSRLRPQTPTGWSPSAVELRRADALFAELNRRARGE